MLSTVWPGQFRLALRSFVQLCNSAFCVLNHVLHPWLCPVSPCSCTSYFPSFIRAGQFRIILCCSAQFRNATFCMRHRISRLAVHCHDWADARVRLCPLPSTSRGSPASLFDVSRSHQTPPHVIVDPTQRKQPLLLAHGMGEQSVCIDIHQIDHLDNRVFI